MATDPTAELFESIKRRGHVPALRRESGTVRFDLRQDSQVDKWIVEIRNGDLNVTRGEDRDGQCVVYAHKSVFDRIARGEENANVAIFRGEIHVEGNFHLISAIERLFPGPRNAFDPRAARAERTRQS